MIDGLRPYPQYKDSGSPWLGDVPVYWQVPRIKTVLRERDARSRDGKGTLLSLTRNRGLIPHHENTEKLHSAKTLIGYKLYSPGQIVMNRMQAWSGMFGAGAIEGLVSPDYAVFEIVGGHNVNFMLERLKTADLVGRFALESKGIGSGFNRLYTDRFGPISMSMGPPDEQSAIVRFLDYANGKIERAIRAKRKLISLLNEQKQAIIHRAVTRGLDADVKLKPSGIPWLDDVPEHWEVKKLRYLFRYAKGSRAAELTNEYIGRHSGDYPVYSGQTENDGLMGKIDWHEFSVESPVVFDSTVGARAMSTRIVEGKFSLSQNCAVIIPRTKDADPVFFESVFQRLFSYERASISLIMQPSLRFADLNRFYIP